MIDAYSILGKDAEKIAQEIGDFSYVATHYVKLLISGKSFAEVVKYLNTRQYY